MEYSTLEARLATFEPPSKRSKLGWPHKTPKPEDLAKAGFYYQPSSQSNDNAVCYLCARALDGWEPDDDPIQEHLKHAGDCGWAILMNAGHNGSLDLDNMEDPTGQQFVDARRATFSIGWPHESKRGWTCKIDKMVEAGWYYAPTPDSDDFVSCIYCKLSLDGWEPKDNPFHEHYRRSQNCPFFHFAGTTAPTKRPKAKKGRASKASRTSKASTRLSTQSNTTMLSQGPSTNDIPDLDESIDTSTMSVMSTMSTASTATTKGKRKGAGGRGKATKSKRAKTVRSVKSQKEETEPEPEPEGIQEQGVQAEQEPERMSIQAEEATTELSAPSQQQSLPSPAPSPQAEVVYPTISNTPRISNEPRNLSPIGVPPQPSPTPVKTYPATSAARSLVTATPRTAARSQAAEDNAPPPTPNMSSPSSDIENAPPSTRPASVRPPPPSATQAQSKSQSHSIPHLSPNSALPTIQTWMPADIELIFQPAMAQPADIFAPCISGGTLSAAEQKMTVQEWIEHVATQAEAGLRAEAERVVGVFEREGQRAMGILEEIECV